MSESKSTKARAYNVYEWYTWKIEEATAVIREIDCSSRLRAAGIRDEDQAYFDDVEQGRSRKRALMQMVFE